MARMARIMAMQKAVCRVFIREIREIRGSIPFGCGFVALGVMGHFAENHPKLMSMNTLHAKSASFQSNPIKPNQG